MYSSTNKSGFTLIELVMVAAILIILSLFAFSAFYQSRTVARDMARISYVDQLRLALDLYKENNGGYPQYDVGFEIGVGNPIDADLAPYIAEIKADPRAEEGGGGDYSYWYFYDFECNGETKPAILVRSMEKETNGNYESVCGD